MLDSAETVKRRRECEACEHRWTTVEVIEGQSPAMDALKVLIAELITNDQALAKAIDTNSKRRRFLEQELVSFLEGSNGAASNSNRNADAYTNGGSQARHAT